VAYEKILILESTWANESDDYIRDSRMRLISVATACPPQNQRFSKILFADTGSRSMETLSGVRSKSSGLGCSGREAVEPISLSIWVDIAFRPSKDDL
jgi:hypothetical protein